MAGKFYTLITFFNLILFYAFHKMVRTLFKRLRLPQNQKMKDVQKCIEIYKEQLNKGYIQTAYSALIKYEGELRSVFPKEYHTGNI